jgi:hypothetical protein
MERLWQRMVQRFRPISLTRRQLMVLAGTGLAIVFLTLATTNRNSSRAPSNSASSSGNMPAVPADFPPLPGVSSEKSALTVPPLASHIVRQNDVVGTTSEPQISYSAELSVVTREFARSRSSLEQILDRHRGYTAKLRMVGQPSGSILSATLRVPASEYGPALEELKSVGYVEHDEESADEVTQQRGDLEARLQNAQNTERRLQQLLQDRKGKTADLTSIARQLAALRAEMETMEAQRHAFDSRVVFSNIYFSMREERIVPAESLASQFHSAMSAGLADALHNLSAILLFLASYGPSLLLWAAVLYFPARALWRRYRRSPPLPSTASA